MYFENSRTLAFIRVNANCGLRWKPGRWTRSEQSSYAVGGGDIAVPSRENSYRLQEWRAFQMESARNTAPVLEYSHFVLHPSRRYVLRHTIISNFHWACDRVVIGEMGRGLNIFPAYNLGSGLVVERFAIKRPCVLHRGAISLVFYPQARRSRWAVFSAPAVPSVRGSPRTPASTGAACSAQACRVSTRAPGSGAPAWPVSRPGLCAWPTPRAIARRRAPRRRPLRWRAGCSVCWMPGSRRAR